MEDLAVENGKLVLALEVPLENMSGIRADPGITREKGHTGLKLTGARLGERMIAGSFRQDGKTVFWDFHDRSKVIVIDLHDEHYACLIVQVADPAAAGDVVGALVAGLETQLGPTWRDGVELSFGQWQRLALARGFMRDAPLMLALDEPTAALAAETEHALFERYVEAARGGAHGGRITILVSHRFSTVRMADLILVMDGGQVAEQGSHEELMAPGGRYAELYGIQAASYR